jgi:flagellar biosynthesis/type III secretory pathway protein FliH
MRVFAPEAFKQLRDAVHVDVVADESLAPGGCVVRTDRTEVDATLETQIAVMVRTILGREHTDG